MKLLGVAYKSKFKAIEDKYYLMEAEYEKMKESEKYSDRELQKAHVSRLTKNKCTPQAGMIFSDVVSGLERVADHATNIAFAITASDTDVEHVEG